MSHRHRGDLYREGQWPTDDECLNVHSFTDVAHAQHLLEAWRQDYNHLRPTARAWTSDAQRVRRITSATHARSGLAPTRPRLVMGATSVTAGLSADPLLKAGGTVKVCRIERMLESTASNGLSASDLVTIAVSIVALIVAFIALGLARRQVDLANQQLGLAKRQDVIGLKQAEIAEKQDKIMDKQLYLRDELRAHTKSVQESGSDVALFVGVENRGSKTADTFYWHLLLSPESQARFLEMKFVVPATGPIDQVWKGQPVRYYSGMYNGPVFPTRFTAIISVRVSRSDFNGMSVCRLQTVSEGGVWPAKNGFEEVLLTTVASLERDLDMPQVS
jgi:hypothetical protein